MKHATNHIQQRYLQGEERETVEHKLKILKQEIKYMIEKLTNLKDFVFANPLLPFGTIWEAYTHCTHLQIAQANPQTKICKKVQSLPTHGFAYYRAYKII